MAKDKGRSDHPLNDRALSFLKALVELHIRDGMPVGSRTLARDAGLDLSPATVRNVMADLEDMGLVVSPHTSAGRVPTAAGYRLFVDSLLTTHPLSEAELASLRANLHEASGQKDFKQLLATASNLLSGLTNLAGVVTVPKRESNRFRQIELVALTGTKVLVILVTLEGEVHNRIINVGTVFSAAELEQASNYLTDLFAGADLRHVRERILAELKATHANMNRIMRDALTIADGVLESAEGNEDLYLAGQTNLMGYESLADLERLRSLFDAFTQKRQILDILDRCMLAEGVQIFIGEESGYNFLSDCSVVTSGYVVDDEVVGVLGVIGPARMNYQRVVPLVDVTARMLSAVLKQ